MLPDHDLRQSFPAYTITGDYLVKLLGHIYNKDPDAPLFTRYASWPQIETAFRNQLVLFTRGLPPFHRKPKPSTEHTYWEALCTMPTAELLAHLGVVLSSIVPNSMAEERSTSTLTKLNSPDRASQKVSTLIDMAAIRQHYKRKENQGISVSLSHYLRSFMEADVQYKLSGSLCPTVRFADLSHASGGISQGDASLAAPCVEPDVNEDSVECLDDGFTSSDLPDNERETPRGNRRDFEVELTDGISLSSKILADLICDRASTSIGLIRPAESPPVEIQPPRKRQRVDVSTLSY